MPLAVAPVAAQPDKVYEDLKIDPSTLCLNNQSKPQDSQKFYTCITCSTGSENRICETCINKCHFKHDFFLLDSKNRNNNQNAKSPCECGSGKVKIKNETVGDGVKVSNPA